MSDYEVFYTSKDPAEDHDFGFDWTDKLEEDETIDTYDLTVPDGITMHTESNTDTLVIFWLSGGTAGTTYRLNCEITTSAGRVWKRSLDVHIFSK